MKIKKALCLLLSLVMILATAPSAIISAEENETTDEIKVYMTVVNKGVIASDNEGNIMANRELTVSDIDEDGKFTFHEALIAAHKEYNSEEGYDAGSGNGVSVVKLWGIDSYNNLFFINDAGLKGGVGTDEVEEGDFLTTSICQDNKYYGDRYTFFDKKEVTAIENEEFTLNLKGFWGMAYEEEELLPKPFEGLSLCTWQDGELKEIEGKVTDEEGNVNLSFSEAGTYYVTAKGTVKAMVTDWWTMKEVEADCPIIAPLCIVTVEEAEELAPPESITVEHDAKNVIDGVIIAKKGDKFNLLAFDENGEETPVTWKNTSYGNMVTIDEETGEVEVTEDVYGGTSYLYFEATSTIDENVKKEVTVLMTGFILSQYQKEQTVTLSEDGQTAKTASLNAGKKGHNIWNYNSPDGVAELTADPGNGGEIKFNVYRPGIIEVGFAIDINEELSDSGIIKVEGVAVETLNGERGKVYLEIGNEEEAPATELTAFVAEGREVSSWISLDEDIATVSENGVVTAVGVGSVIIQAVDNEGAKGGIKVVVESREIPYFESIEFQTSYLASGSWVKGETFNPTVTEYDLTVSRYSLSNLVFLKDTLYDDVKYSAKALYEDVYGEEKEVYIHSGAATTLSDIPFGTSAVTVTLYEKENEKNKTVYTFNVTRPRDKTKALKTVTVNPEGRTLSNTLYEGYKEGTMLRCDEEGTLTSVTGIYGSHYYYRTYVYGETDFTLSFAASTAYAHIRYSVDGEEWTELDSLLKSEKLSFDEDGVIELYIEIADDDSYTADKEAEGDGFSEGNTVSYKLTLMNVSAEAPKMLTAEAEGDWYPAFSPDFYTYRIMTESDANAPVLTFTAEEGAIVKDGKEIIEPDENGIYSVTLKNTQKSITLSDSEEKCVNTYKFQYTRKSSSAVPDKVVEAVYIGGQYSGNYDIYPELTLTGSMRSLGNFGGYITYYFEEALKDNPNNMYGMEFYIFGNSMEMNIDSMAELGQVYVSEDGETWYALAGSEHYEDKALWDYEITYKKGEDGKAYWTDNYGNEMLVSAAKAWPTKEKYPLNPYTEDDEYTFSGILFKCQQGSVMGDSTNGSFASKASFGYADYYKNGSIVDGMVENVNSYVENPTMANGFDLLWAVDDEGNPVDVSDKEFHYVKVATASNIWAGSFFEKSTEISNVIRTTPEDSEVGKTEAPESVVFTDGISEVKVNISEDKNIYDVDLGDMKYISVKLNGAKEDDNIYINNQRIESDEAGEGFKVTKKNETLVRLIVQNGDREPYLALFRLSGTAKETDELIEGIKINVGGDIRETTTKNKKTYAAEVGSKVESVKIFPVVKNDVKVLINGEEMLSEYALSFGKNTFEITVSDGAEEKTVILNITRKKETTTSDNKISVSFT
ncbi:MAG: Ig-like domain-containing protein, partial [Clostridia bacterium]|nr:Ig-like domain-containing protein [Clostridia bacterium]